MKKEKQFSTILNEGLPTAAERKAKMDAVKAMSLDELIDKYIPDSFINGNGDLQCEHHRFCGPTFGDWLYFKKDGIYWNCRRGNQISKEIFEKQYEWHPGDSSHNDLAMISDCTEIPIYVLKLIFEKFNAEKRISESKMKNSHLFDNILKEGKLNEGLFGTSHLTLREFFNIKTFYCSSKTRFCIFDGDKDKPDVTLVVYEDDIIEGEEEVQPYLDKRIEYINFDAHRVNIGLITQMKEASSLKESYDEQSEEADKTIFSKSLNEWQKEGIHEVEFFIFNEKWVIFFNPSYNNNVYFEVPEEGQIYEFNSDFDLPVYQVLQNYFITGLESDDIHSVKVDYWDELNENEGL